MAPAESVNQIVPFDANVIPVGEGLLTTPPVWPDLGMDTAVPIASPAALVGSMMTAPIAPAPFSVNQRLSPGPAVMPSGLDPVGAWSSVTKDCVVGLIAPT